MTQVWNTVTAWRDRRQALTGRTIGFVPTMGALHCGHASLVERCRRENEIVVVSIFVNPTQFNDPQDLDRYPRTLDNDLALLQSLGADEVFVPGASELYPVGLLKKGDRQPFPPRESLEIQTVALAEKVSVPFIQQSFRVEPDTSSQVMEGLHRPGFLQGVATVVMKLLNIVGPDRAYFGEKDYQQLMVVTEMVREFFISTEIVPCSTVRERTGLAASSRNALLSAAAREKAASLYRALTTAAGAAQARAILQAEGFVVEYVEERWGRRLAAVLLDGVRLIDNVPIAEIERASYT